MTGKRLSIHNGDVTDGDADCDHDWRTYEAVVGRDRIDICEYCGAMR